MNRLLPLSCALVALILAACGPKPPETPPAPQKSVAEERRERWFGVELAQKPGIEWRETGLGIERLTPGEGAPPARTDKVRVNYVGRLLDGTEFDSNAKSGKPAEFRVDHLVTGLASAMTTLKPGAKARVYIPPHLGYGGIKAGKIPANSSLVFEVELLAVNPTDETKR